MTALAAILRNLAPTPEAAAVALDKLHPLEMAEKPSALASAIARSTAIRTPNPQRFPRQITSRRAAPLSKSDPALKV